jgi:hypothetical protein
MTRTLHEQNHDADPEYLELRPCKYLDPHDKTRKNRYPRDKRNQHLVPLSVPHRHPLGLNTMCSGERAQSFQKHTLRDHEDMSIERWRCRKAACGCYGPRTCNLRKLAHDSPKCSFQSDRSDAVLSFVRSHSLPAYLFPKNLPCDDRQKPNQMVSRPTQTGPGRR